MHSSREKKIMQLWNNKFEKQHVGTCYSETKNYLHNLI